MTPKFKFKDNISLKILVMTIFNFISAHFFQREDEFQVQRYFKLTDSTAHYLKDSIDLILFYLTHYWYIEF